MRRSKKNNFTHWMGKATGRKGMGMELALLVLFVVFACSILMVSSAMLGKSNINDRKDKMVQRFELDQFAEQMLAGGTDNHEKYDAVRFNNRLDIYDGEQIVLTVYLNGNTITGWKYG